MLSNLSGTFVLNKVAASMSSCDKSFSVFLIAICSMSSFKRLNGVVSELKYFIIASISTSYAFFTSFFFSSQHFFIHSSNSFWCKASSNAILLLSARWYTSYNSSASLSVFVVFSHSKLNAIARCNSTSLFSS